MFQVQSGRALSPHKKKSMFFCVAPTHAHFPQADAGIHSSGFCVPMHAKARFPSALRRMFVVSSRSSAPLRCGRKTTIQVHNINQDPSLKFSFLFEFSLAILSLRARVNHPFSVQGELEGNAPKNAAEYSPFFSARA
jgi:hypothetical protein